MLDVDQIRGVLLSGGLLADFDRGYTFYYDETNNIRKLHLEDGALNIRRPECFVLGGIVHRGPPRDLDLADLRRRLRLQPSVNELKMRHLGKGDFLSLLDSDKVGSFLEWVSDNDFLVHFQALDVLYWSIVDIVDSMLPGLESRELMVLHRDIKNSLYGVLRIDIEATATFLARFDYPNVGKLRQAEFLGGLLGIVEENRQVMSPIKTEMLRGILKSARRLDSLPFLEDESPNILIEGFGQFYLSRLCLFTRSRHVLDEEEQIKAYLRAQHLVQDGEELRHFRFADSRSETGIQVSDAITGILGKLFGYVGRTSRGQLEEQLSHLTARQRRNLGMLAQLLDRSTDECPAFAHYILSDDDIERAHFLFAEGMSHAGNPQ